MLSTSALLLFLFLISVTILVSSLSHKTVAKSKKKRPPGPWALPFIGSIHHLLTSQPQATLRDLAEKYGPVMYLRLGQNDTVVVSSPEVAQVVLRDQDINFASRPHLLSVEIIGYGGHDFAFAPYGAYWRVLRKLCTMELLSTRKVKQLAPIRDSETMSLVREIRRSCGSGEPFNLGSLLVSCSNSITGLATFGDRFSSEHKEKFLSVMAVVLSDCSGFCISDLFPSMWFLDVATGMRRRLQMAHEQLDQVLGQIIEACEARRKVKNAEDGDDILSIMLRIKDEEEFEFPFNITHIKAVIIDLFIGGTETTSSTAEWVMSELMRNPEAMAKAQAEVREALNNKNPGDQESLLGGLNYTGMVIKETLRLHPTIPLLLPRLCRETCNVAGFEVSKGTRVIINAWAMARSPKHWDDPEEFKPERFLATAADYKGTQLEYLPFGSGRRMCPGMGFGLATLELIVVRLLYYFDWSLPAGIRSEELDMDTTVGATARRTNQLRLVATPYEHAMEI
ncbi:unnamed protein product [Miscanthus lutarioriparius]|uniref:Cytochrome P450 n=1 Tax=Miscanthus lutarioriparius TaxID=422564 RepID=A0A811PZP1_9POAL|nr:unnamed protein product [Miscanthus lutarioriparius]